MRCIFGLLVACGLALCGCELQQSSVPAPAPVETTVEATPATDDLSETPATTDPSTAEPAESTPGSEPVTGTNEPTPATGEAPTATEPASAPATESAALAPVALNDGVATLSPGNTKIQFTGTHSPPKAPDPRVGGFAKFSGEAKVDAEGKTLESVRVEIDTTSLFTTIPDPNLNEKLANHLRTADFFDVREYPTAKFESTEITVGEDGLTTIKGNLTLHGQTKEVSFPAAVSITGEGLTLKSDFSINRSEFGMTFGEGQVDDKVSLTVVIGEKTQTS